MRSLAVNVSPAELQRTAEAGPGGNSRDRTIPRSFEYRLVRKGFGRIICGDCSSIKAEEETAVGRVLPNLSQLCSLDRVCPGIERFCCLIAETECSHTGRS